MMPSTSLSVITHVKNLHFSGMRSKILRSRIILLVVIRHAQEPVGWQLLGVYPWRASRSRDSWLGETMMESSRGPVGRSTIVVEPVFSDFEALRPSAARSLRPVS